MRQVFLFIFCGLTCVTFSQDNQFLFGSRINLVTTQIDGDRYGGFDKAGIRLGIFTQKELTQTLDFSLGLGYIQKGSRKIGDEKNLNRDYYKISTQYVEVPVTFIKDFGKFNAVGGLSFNVLFAHKEEDYAGVTLNSMNMNRIDISYVLGAEFELNKKFVFEAGIINSLLPAADELQPSQFGLFGGAYNVVVNLGLAYVFTSI